ncbi:PRA1 family protein B2-like [Andrographis paniculata]|uniref:PRA1 family protein B2-like n=1 Tax=Andrographis paniculata TaxID=175694 RepID=UPI0021E7BAFB|nr:PRA1 family protein B2-like [Andrographis paniculata]
MLYSKRVAQSVQSSPGKPLKPLALAPCSEKIQETQDHVQTHPMATISPSPGVLPVTNSQAAVPSPDDRRLSSVRDFLSGISETVRSGLANRRPWPELLDRSAFSKPDSFSEACLRLRKNYNYFRINYAVLISAVLAVSLLTNPLSLIFLAALLAAWLFLCLFRQPSDPPLTLFGRQFSDRETFFGLILSTIVIIFLTSVGSVLVSALVVGVGLVSLHGAFRTPEDLFLDEQEPQGGGVSGLLSFLTPGAPDVAQPPVAAATV